MNFETFIGSLVFLFFLSIPTMILAPGPAKICGLIMMLIPVGFYLFFRAGSWWMRVKR